MPIQTVNPFTNEMVNTFTELRPDEIDGVISQADKAYRSWKNTPFSERKKLMLKVAKILRDETEHYAKFPTLEMGKLYKESINWEVDICAQISEYYAKNGEKFMAPETLKWSLITGSTVVEKHPLGVLFGIMPWNYPYYQVFRFAVPNIMAGNTVIIKHASNVPQCALAIEEIFQKAGFPKGVYSNVLVSGRNSSQIIEDVRVRGISLTGSETAGAKVAELAGKNLKKVVLELGGSDPFILLDDAELDYATDLAMLGRFFNSGQTCIASKRFIVHEKIYDAFLEQFKTKVATLKAGDPMDMNTNFAPMSSQDEVEHLHGLVQKAVEQGATLECGGQKIDLPGAWLEPTLLSNVTADMDIYRQELFGPVAVLHKVTSDEEAVRIANDSPYGLSSVIVGNNDKRIDAIATQLETGMTFINSVSITEPDLPFGGVKNSGFGRELAAVGMDEFVNRKTVRRLPVWAFKQILKSQ